MELVYSGFKQRFEQDGKPFYAQIYSGTGSLPSRFNVGKVELDASEHASLRWDVEKAHQLPSILWDLDFQLSEEIVADEGRYLTLELAACHFSKTVWPDFEKKTFGVLLYKGPFRETLIEPLIWLVSHVQARPFLLLETDPIPDAVSYFHMLSRLQLTPFIPILKGRWAKAYPYASPALAGDHPFSPLGIYAEKSYPPFPEKPLPVALLVSEKGEMPLLEGAFRIISEPLLIQEWEGVDYLIVKSSMIDERARRKLAGFCAAGGEVITLGEPLGLPFERSISSLDGVASLQLPGISPLSSQHA